jgi:DNA gyrase subunit A
MLLAMRDAGVLPGGSYRRSATILRDVFKPLRPRARDSAYDAVVAMVQDFTFRYPLIEGQGNFGSISGDPAGAPQYTEVRLSPIAGELVSETDRADGSAEPGVLGAAAPNLIINGSAAWPPNTLTNIPPHNLREVVSAAIFLMDHPDATPSDLRALIPGPDFPTGASIYEDDGIREYQETGRGRLITRARATIEKDEASDRSRIVVTELPYGITDTSLVEDIAQMIRARTLDGIGDLHFESSRDGVCLVMILKPDVSPHWLLHELYERTDMQTYFDVNMTALVPQPATGALVPSNLTLKEMLEHFIAHRHAVVARRIEADGGRADLASREKRMHLIKDDLTRIAEVYGDDRRTQILTCDVR